MTTTSLVVELLIVGSGAAVALASFVLALLASDPDVLGFLFTLPGLISAVPILYVLGILVDRAADALMARPKARLQAGYFEGEKDHHLARTEIYASAPKLIPLFEYSSSRIRICRGWVLNSGFLIVGLNAYLWSRAAPASVAMSSFATSIVLAAIGIGSWLAWRSLTRDELRRLREQSDYLSRRRAATQRSVHETSAGEDTDA